MRDNSNRKWSSELLFITVSIATAIGINTVWRFSWLAGENGGGAFVLIFILAQFLIACPALVAEYAVGRMGGLSVVGTMDRLREKYNISRWWRYYGMMGVIAVFMILTFYCVVGGWTVDFFVQALFGEFNNITPEKASSNFEDLLASPWRLMISQIVFIALAAWIVSGGIKKGIEPILSWMTFGLFIILGALLVYALFATNFWASVRFMFVINPEDITIETVTKAFGHAFFSLGVGVGVMLTLGAYMDKSYSIGKASMVVGVANAVVSIVAGLTIFAIALQFNLPPSAGVGLPFQSLPVAFGEMTGGYFFGTMFFLLLAIAGLTSAVTLIESIVAVLEDFTTLSRKTLVALTGFGIWAVGILTVLSFNVLADFHPLAALPVLNDMTFFGIFDYVASNILMPLGGILISILAVWVLSQQVIHNEVRFRSNVVYTFWYWTVRYIVPLAVLVLLISNL